MSARQSVQCQRHRQIQHDFGRVVDRGRFAPPPIALDSSALRPLTWLVSVSTIRPA